MLAMQLAMQLAPRLSKCLSKSVPFWLFIMIPLLVLLVKWPDGYRYSLVENKPDVYAKPETAPLLFVGGHESSGTTLLRVLLDAHPMIRCGSEAMTIMHLFEYRNHMNAHHLVWSRAAGVYPDVLDRAIAQYVLTTVRDMGPPADILCYKRPMLIKYMDQLSEMFPRAKFVHVLRDGRASVASSLKRGITHGTDAPTQLGKWAKDVGEIMLKCQNLTEQRCLTIRYEYLVVDSETELRRITEFLGIPWDPIVLRHHTILKNLTQLSIYEPSTSRAKQKIDTKSLTKWYKDDKAVGKYLRNVDKDCPLLRAMGFIQCGKPPDYARLSRKVWLNASALH